MRYMTSNLDLKTDLEGKVYKMKEMYPLMLRMYLLDKQYRRRRLRQSIGQPGKQDKLRLQSQNKIQVDIGCMKLRLYLKNSQLGMHYIET